MKICLAQLQSISGNVIKNIDNHILFIKKAIDLQADIIVFPELSITNYEPTLAKKLATQKDDERFTIFQQLADENNIAIGVGVPINSKKGITISMLVFQAKKEVINYAKQIIHEDELPYFVCGNTQKYISINNKKIAFAICYESMKETHFINVCNNKTDIYIASVAKTDKGLQDGMIHYQSISEKYQKTVLMVNAIGRADNFINAGQSVVFKNGKQIQALNNKEQGILVFDTNTNTSKQYYFN